MMMIIIIAILSLVIYHYHYYILIIINHNHTKVWTAFRNYTLSNKIIGHRGHQHEKLNNICSSDLEDVFSKFSGNNDDKTLIFSIRTHLINDQ